MDARTRLDVNLYVHCLYCCLQDSKFWAPWNSAQNFLQVLSLYIFVIAFTPKRKVWHSLSRITLNFTATFVDMTLNFTQRWGVGEGWRGEGGGLLKQGEKLKTWGWHRIKSFITGIIEINRKRKEYEKVHRTRAAATDAISGTVLRRIRKRTLISYANLSPATCTPRVTYLGLATLTPNILLCSPFLTFPNSRSRYVNILMKIRQPPLDIWECNLNGRFRLHSHQIAMYNEACRLHLNYIDTYKEWSVAHASRLMKIFRLRNNSILSK